MRENLTSWVHSQILGPRGWCGFCWTTSPFFLWVSDRKARFLQVQKTTGAMAGAGSLGRARSWLYKGSGPLRVGELSRRGYWGGSGDLLVRKRWLWLELRSGNSRLGLWDPSFWTCLPAMPPELLFVVVVPVPVVVDMAGDLGVPCGHH